MEVFVIVAVAVGVNVGVGDGEPVFVAVGVKKAAGSASVQSLNDDTPVMVAVFSVVSTVPPGCVNEPLYF